MRILICDDDALITVQLQKLIRNYFEQHHINYPEISCFSDGSSLLADEGEKDILFLDIEMPGMNGIYLGNELTRQNDKIIIIVITSHLEYLDDAMRFHVFRYLTKPLERQRLFRNMKDALAQYYRTSNKISLETRQGIQTLPASSLIAVEAKDRKIILYTEQQNYESIHKIEYWVNYLPSNLFYQTHRSYIVNFDHVISFDHTLVYLTGNHQAYLTRRRYSAFKESYLLYLEGRR